MVISTKEDAVDQSSEFYLNMIQAVLDQAEEVFADGHVERARNLIAVVIADCKILNLELKREKGSK